MGLDLLSITRDGNIHKIILIPQILEGTFDALLKIIPPKAKLLIGRAHLQCVDHSNLTLSSHQKGGISLLYNFPITGRLLKIPVNDVIH